MTEYKKDCCSCSWLPLEVSVQLCSGMDAPIVVRVYDYDRDGTNVSNLLCISVIFHVWIFINSKP